MIRVEPADLLSLHNYYLKIGKKNTRKERQKGE